MKKKFLAVLTAATMVLSLLPASIHAETYVRNGYSEILAADYDYWHNVKPNEEKIPTSSNAHNSGEEYCLGGLRSSRGVIFTDVDFGEGAEELIVDVQMACWPTQDIAGCNLQFLKGGDNLTDNDGDYGADNNYGANGEEIVSVPGFTTSNWNMWQIKHFEVTNPELLKGVINLNLYITGSKTSFPQLYSFQFNKPVTPYEEILEDSIIGAKEVKSLKFGNLGANSVELAYTEGATGTVSIYKDSINGAILTNDTLVQTITLDGTGMQTVALEKTDYMGYADLYFVVSDGVELASVKFNECQLNDPFEGQTELKVSYVGNQAQVEGDWSSAVKAEFETTCALPERTFTDSYVDLGSMTDVAYLDYIESVNIDADIVFIQAGNRAESFLDAISKMAEAPMVVVIGEADYAEKYGITASATPSEILGIQETYAVPTPIITRNGYEPIYAITYDESTAGKQDGNNNCINNLKAGSYVTFKDVKLDKGISQIIIAYSKDVDNQDGTAIIKLGGPDGEEIGRISSTERNGHWYEPFYEGTVDVNVSVSGIYDVCMYIDGSNGVSEATKFAGTSYIKFVPNTTINAANELNAINGTASDGVSVVNGVYHGFTAEDTASYSVDFGETTKSYAVTVEAAASEGTTGTIILDDGENTIASFDLTGADGNFKESLAIAELLSGVKNLTVTYEGEGECSIKSISFGELTGLDTTFDTTNYSPSTTATVGNTFGGFNTAGRYACWENIDFGNNDTLYDVTITYGAPWQYSGNYITVRADSPSGEIVARTIIEYQQGMDWAVEKSVTVPVIYLPKGVHDLYVTLERGTSTNDDYNYSYAFANFGGDIFRVEFNEYEGTDTYRIDSRTWARYDGTTVIPKTIRTILTYINDETTPEKVSLVAAVYDSNNQLQGVDYKAVDTVDGLNSLIAEIPYSKIGENYTYKYFIWDGTTMMPLTTGDAYTQSVTK